MTLPEEIFGTYPREMAFPRKVIYTEKERNKEINDMNGLLDVYTSLYSFRHIIPDEKRGVAPAYKTANVSCVFFDVDFHDVDDFEWKEIVKSTEIEYEHFWEHSGRGLHLFIGTTGVILNNPKISLRSFAFEFLKDTDLPNVDRSTIGDIAQIVRFPFTYNTKANRIALPIDPISVKTMDDRIKTTGTKRIDLTEYTSDFIPIDRGDNIGMIDLPMDVPENLAPCFKKMMAMPRPSHHERIFVLCALRDYGIPKLTLQRILEEWLGPKPHPRDENLYKHVMKEGILDRIFKVKQYGSRRGTYKFYNRCDEIKRVSVCPGCPGYNPRSWQKTLNVIGD